MYCLPTDTLNRLKLLERTYIIFEGNKYPLSFQHKNMTDITHSFTKTCFFHYIQLNNYSFACNNSRKKRGKGRHYSKIGAYQKRRTGGRKGETDTSSQTVIHLLCFFVMWQNILTHSSLYFVLTTKEMEIKFFILCTYRHFFKIKLRLLIHISIYLGLVQKKTLTRFCWIILHAHNKCF